MLFEDAPVLNYRTSSINQNYANTAGHILVIVWLWAMGGLNIPQPCSYRQSSGVFFHHRTALQTAWAFGNMSEISMTPVQEAAMLYACSTQSVFKTGSFA